MDSGFRRNDGKTSLFGLFQQPPKAQDIHSQLLIRPKFAVLTRFVYDRPGRFVL